MTGEMQSDKKNKLGIYKGEGVECGGETWRKPSGLVSLD